MNYDLFDDLLSLWRSTELMTRREKEYLSEEIVVTEENVNELRGEIAMYNDLMVGKITLDVTEGEDVNNRLTPMFSHVKQKYRDKLKEKLLGG